VGTLLVDEVDVVEGSHVVGWCFDIP
jgi:hypothetical protein